MSLPSIKNNLFFGGNIGPNVVIVTINPFSSDGNVSPLDWIGNLSSLDPSFVITGPSDITLSDFHLLASSPCITGGDTSVGFNNAGDPSGTDIGAYGGQSDRIPIVVSGVSGVVSASSGTITDTISLKWSPNNAYSTKGYNVHYGQASGGSYTGTDAVVSGVTRTSPIDVVTSTSVILTGLTTTAVTPAAPVLITPEPRNEGLSLSWSAVPGATSYIITYSLTSAPTLTFPPITVVNTTSYTLTGLTNGELYTITITAEAQSAYYLAVTAYDLSSTAGDPGSSGRKQVFREWSCPWASREQAGRPTPSRAFPRSSSPTPTCRTRDASSPRPPTGPAMLLPSRSSGSSGTGISRPMRRTVLCPLVLLVLSRRGAVPE